MVPIIYYSPSVPVPQNVFNSTPSSLVLSPFMRASCRKVTNQQDKLEERLTTYLFILLSFKQTHHSTSLLGTGKDQQSSCLPGTSGRGFG